MRHLSLREKLAILLGIAVLCLAMARTTADFTGKALFNELLAPVQGTVMRAWYAVGSSFEHIGQARRISKENDELRQKVRELTWENNRLNEYVYENQRLLKLLDFKERHAQQLTLLGARVISRAPNNQSGVVVVDRGSADGVKINMVAVSDAGLVGKVVSVGDHTAEILLILDREGAAGAMVQETRTPGVIEGSREGLDLLQMVDLPYDAKLKKGQVVITSGMGGIFPRGLPVGKILRVEGSGLNQFAVVQPFVDFSRLEEVFLITEVREVAEPMNTSTDNSSSTDN
jgi:rod shape-determining protein MreC